MIIDLNDGVISEEDVNNMAMSALNALASGDITPDAVSGIKDPELRRKAMEIIDTAKTGALDRIAQTKSAIKPIQPIRPIRDLDNSETLLAPQSDDDEEMPAL